MAEYINRIDRNYSKLTKTERKIAQYIQKEETNISYESLQEMSQKLAVGESTIVRFCQKLGYSGFQELKHDIMRQEGAHALVSEVYSESYVDKIVFNYHDTILKTRDKVEIAELEKSVELLDNSKHIVACGMGASGLSAVELEVGLLKFGKIIKTVLDPHLQVIHISNMGPDDLLIMFSLTGLTQEALETVKYAKKVGCKVIAITNYKTRPLAQLADCVLCTAKKETAPDGGIMMAKISQLYIIDLLCTTYSIMHEKDKGNTIPLIFRH